MNFRSTLHLFWLIFRNMGRSLTLFNTACELVRVFTLIGEYDQTYMGLVSAMQNLRSSRITLKPFRVNESKSDLIISSAFKSPSIIRILMNLF